MVFKMIFMMICMLKKYFNPKQGSRQKNTPPPGEGGISADVFWWKNTKGEEKKGVNVKEKGRKGKEKGREQKNRKGDVKGLNKDLGEKATIGVKKQHVARRVNNIIRREGVNKYCFLAKWNNDHGNPNSPLLSHDAGC